MRNLDFLSNSPNIYIFKERTNKTTFGGVLFLIYIIIMMIISLIYIIDYFVNDKYIIENTEHLNLSYNELMNPFSYLDNIQQNDSETNPLINISFNLFKLNESKKINLSDRFIVQDAFTYEKLQRNKFYQRKVSDIGVIVLYQCEDENCTLNDEDYSKFDYYFEIIYNGFELDHSKSIPLKNNKNILFKNYFFFSFNNTKLQGITWEVIKYKEERGIMRLFDKMMGRKNEYISGYISPSEFTYIGHPVFSQNITNTKVLSEYIMVKGLRQYIEYKRRKISMLDVLANIGALFSTLFSCFTFAFKYYSINFDNYKIIQKIVRPKVNFTKKTKKVKNIELNEFNPDYIDKDKENNLINDDDGIINGEADFDDIEKEVNKDFKKLTFAQFFLNNIYCKKFTKLNAQEIIRICNEIMSNYLSVESILYNQIMLENILKDYKWNNQELNSIDNNNLVLNLKKLI